MIKLYQVVAMDKKGYIEGYRDFRPPEIENMLRHIQILAVSGNINKIEIVRWNEKGERE